MLLAAVCFAVIAIEVLTGSGLTRIDLQWAMWLQAHANAPLTAAMLALSWLHDTVPTVAATLLLVALLWRLDQRRWSLTVAAAVGPGMFLNWCLKQLFSRQRPSVGPFVQLLQSYSFPSGHTIGATLLYGVLAAYGIAHVRHAGTRWAIAVLAAAAVVAVAFSRLYLGVHFLSDVLAAVCVGVFWLALCLTVAHALAPRFGLR